MAGASVEKRCFGLRTVFKELNEFNISYLVAYSDLA